MELAAQKILSDILTKLSHYLDFHPQYPVTQSHHLPSGHSLASPDLATIFV